MVNERLSCGDDDADGTPEQLLAQIAPLLQTMPGMPTPEKLLEEMCRVREELGEDAKTMDIAVAALERLGQPGVLDKLDFAKISDVLGQLDIKIGGDAKAGAETLAAVRQQIREAGGKVPKQLRGLLAGTTVRKDGPRIGRNDKCSCGSGKKYKACCMKR